MAFTSKFKTLAYFVIYICIIYLRFYSSVQHGEIHNLGSHWSLGAHLSGDALPWSRPRTASDSEQGDSDVEGSCHWNVHNRGLWGCRRIWQIHFLWVPLSTGEGEGVGGGKKGCVWNVEECCFDHQRQVVLKPIVASLRLKFVTRVMNSTLSEKKNATSIAISNLMVWKLEFPFFTAKFVAG